MKTIHIGGRKFVPPDTIWYLQSDQNYTKVYLNSGKMYFVATTLKVIENRLIELRNFVRINRGVIINKNFVRERIDSSVIMPNNISFVIARRRNIQ
jgi:two-component system, LytTR family, response regulator